MSSRSLKKRGLSDGSHKASFISEQQLETLTAELEHERSLRLLDQKRFQQKEQRLVKQLELAAEEAKDATSMLEEIRTENERNTQQLRAARNQALQDLRQCQIELEEARADVPDDSSYWQEKCRLLEEELESEREGREKYEEQLHDLREEMAGKLEEYKKIQSTPPIDKKLEEEAPPAVMKELNKVRIDLAESERKQRQLKRAVDELKERNRRLLQYQEEAKNAKSRLSKLEKEQQDLMRASEEAKAQVDTWKAFGSSLRQALNQAGFSYGETSDSTPPEVSYIVRFFNTMQRDFDEMKKLKEAETEAREQARKDVQEMADKVSQMEGIERRSALEINGLEEKIVALNAEIKVLESKIQIGKRESDGLRELIKTFDGLPLAAKGDKDVAMDTSMETEKIAVKALEEEIALLKEERETLLSKNEELRTQAIDSDKELERVKEKFSKLRDALMQEREKVQQAEDRANEAERLSGKGSFNPETTRVLHFKDSPLVEALREEVKVLKRQIEAIKGEKTGKQIANAEKLNQRLKENFREQISKFREGVYLMTGYKVDMIPGTEKPTFRVRSMFAERQEDHLLLKWPDTDEVTSLDIVATDFAKIIAKEPSYQYMAKFHSLPAFMASVQLSLFEKQTVMM